ncbi:MAG: sterol desaturase family protein [Deltaproteobacteria bacterium]|nr:MAG: sterol desaturase family protein [Deltaproteobacteria bacterium]
MFWAFPVTAWLVSTLSFALFATPLTLLAWRDPPALRHRRIQGSRGKPEKWIVPGIAHWARNNLVMGVVTLAAWPLLRLSSIHLGPTPPVWEVLASLVFFVYLDDALYYGMHRTLHHPRLYKHVHAVHHKVTTPWAWAGLYMHPIEYTLTGILTLVGPLLLGSHVITLWIWVAMRQWIAAEGHCGYRLPYNPAHLFPGYGGNDFHDAHHAKFTGNYSGFLGYLDGWLGTYSKGYPPESH